MYETQNSYYTPSSDADYTSYNGSKENYQNVELEDATNGKEADTGSEMTEMTEMTEGVTESEMTEMTEGVTEDGHGNEQENEQGNNVTEGSPLTLSSNAGTPLENPNIPANVDDGNDLEKLDFSAEYASPNGMGDDLLSGTSGTNTFEVNALLNAKPEIIQQHVDGEGRVDWAGVTGENNNYHDHWLDSLGQDTISDFSGSGGEGDKINISGHTVAITLLEETDNQVKLGIYADQGADGTRTAPNAHDMDVLGTLTINHDGNFDYNNDISVNAESNLGAFEFA